MVHKGSILRETVYKGPLSRENGIQETPFKGKWCMRHPFSIREDGVS